MRAGGMARGTDEKAKAPGLPSQLRKRMKWRRRRKKKERK